MPFSKKDNICVVSPLGYTGLSYYDHSFCQSLAERAVRVTLITSAAIVTKPKKKDYEVKKFFKNTYGKKSRFLKGIAYVLALFRVYYFIIANHYKIVHFQILELPAADAWLFRFLRYAGVKICYTPHDIHSFKSTYRVEKAANLYRLSDRVFVHNSANKDQLMKDFGISSEKIRIINHGNYNAFLDPGLTKKEAIIRLHLPPDKKVVLLFGSLRPGKGFETAVRAFSGMSGRGSVLLMIAGKPAREFDIHAFKKLIDQEGIANQVMLEDHFIEDDLVESYYKSADLMLIPYEKIYESAVLKYAFSCGTPVILSDSSVFSDFAKEGVNCLKFRAGAAESLARQLEWAFQNEDLIHAMALNAKCFSDAEWDWKKTAEAVLKIYGELQ